VKSFRECVSHWFLAGYVAYRINDPLYTAPSTKGIYLGLITWIVSCPYFPEVFGNFTFFHADLPMWELQYSLGSTKSSTGWFQSVQNAPAYQKPVDEIVRLRFMPK
jgi:hypothetical protein